MKKTITALSAVFALSNITNAATVVISPGLAASNVQGISLETTADHNNIVASANYYVGVGRYDSVAGTFTPWTTMVNDSATGSPTSEVSGTFVTTTGGAFDGLAIHTFAGLLASVPSGGTTAAFTPVGTQWVIFGSTAAGSVFPVSAGTGSQSVSLSTQANTTIIATGSPENMWNGTSTVSGSATNYYLMAVPETSTSLLGAVGALALLRRRRN